MNLTTGKIYLGNILHVTEEDRQGMGGGAFNTAQYKIVVYNDRGVLQSYLPMHFEPVID